MFPEIVSSPTPVDEAREPLLRALAATFSLYGWPEAMGRIYGALAFADQPLSQDDLAGRLGVSKSTVNTNLRTLESLHFVYRVEGAGGESAGGRPRLFYRAERDFKKVMQELLHHNLSREVELMGAGIEESRRRLQAQASQDASVQNDLEFVGQMENYLLLGRVIHWLVQSAERFQDFLSALRPAER